jgi:hypothetical protein
VDFELLPDAMKAAMLFLELPRHERECSREWISLRITLEHLVCFLARLRLCLAGAVADSYPHQLDLPRAQRFGWNATGNECSASAIGDVRPSF